MIDAKPKCRFRFGRVLLAFTVVASVCFWAHRKSWPQSKDGDHGPFLQSIKQLKAGLNQEQASKLISGTDKASVFKTEVWATEHSDAAHHATVTVGYVWDDAIYCVYYVIEPARKGGYVSPIFDLLSPCTQIQIFRLAERPYGWEDENGPTRGEVISDLPNPAKGDDFANHVYLEEFAKYLSSNRKHNNGFKHELIYSDPPAKPAN